VIDNARTVNNPISNEDLYVFTVVARRANFAAAASELGVSPAYVSKRIRVLESTLQARLLHRTTRRVTVTQEGERAYHWAQSILDNVDRLFEEVSAGREIPRGRLRICSSFGFGRNIVAPAIARLSERYPLLEIRFELLDRIADIASEGFDLDVRVGDDIAPHVIARKLAANRRILCASPDYVARRGAPRSLAELATHDCLVIKERDHPFGIWRLKNHSAEQTVKVTGPLSSNNGEIVLQWAVDGRGIVLRSLWDAGPLVRAGRLVQILPEYTQEANVWAVYPARLSMSAKVRVCVRFLEEYFEQAQPFG